MRRTRALLGSGILFASLIAGCASVYPTAESQAATDFGCTEAQVSSLDMGDLVSKVEGCGKKDFYGLLIGPRRWVSLVERASFELSCKRQELVLSPLAPRQIGVSGCGEKRVYVLTEAGWLLDSGATPPAASAPPAATAAPAAPSEPQPE